MSNKLILSIFVPANSNSDVATIINVERETNKGYAVIVTEGIETRVYAFDKLSNAIAHANIYAACVTDE